ncbi:Rrf2 family transcriptional regulator [Spirillospora sp. NPDC047279]|uniref:RrF2 family transcriptional regulator n=1 Tax=Spirillospora sp. NPDC047279 TaxID=3155478 RepID=UPI0033D65089
MIRLAARTQYALRAMIALAVHGPMSLDRLAADQDIPRRYCGDVLRFLRQADLVHSQRGSDGGYRLAHPAERITLADVIQATEGVSPPPPHFSGAAEPLTEIWERLHRHQSTLLSEITLAHVIGSSNEETTHR